MSRNHLRVKNDFKLCTRELNFFFLLHSCNHNVVRVHILTIFHLIKKNLVFI